MCRKIFLLLDLLLVISYSSVYAFQEDGLTLSLKKSRAYLPVYPDSALLLANDVLEKASKLENEEIIARANYTIGVAYYYQNKFILSQSYYKKALDSPYIDKDLILKEYVLNNMGVNYEMSSEYIKALDVYQMSIKLAENRGDSVSVAQTWINLGLLFEIMKDYDLAESNTLKAKNYFLSISDSANLGLCYQNLSKIKYSRKQYKEALQLSKIGLKLFEELGDSIGIISLISNTGIMASFVDGLAESNKLLKKSLALANRYEVVDIERNSLHQLSINKMNVGDYAESEHLLN